MPEAKMHPRVTSRSASASEASTTTTAAAGTAVPAPVATPTANPSAAATSVAKSTTLTAEGLKNSGPFLQQTPVADQATPVHLPETMDFRDRLFAGISEERSEEGADDEAEVVIEPDGRIKVHPRRRPNYLRYGGALEPPAFGAGLRADRGAIEQDTRAAKDILLLHLLRSQHHDRGGHASGLDSLLEEEARKLLVEEAIAGGVAPHAFAGKSKGNGHQQSSSRNCCFQSGRLRAQLDQCSQSPDEFRMLLHKPAYVCVQELKAGSHSEANSSPGADPYGESRALTSSTGYFVAFIVGFGGILLIAMLCCVIRATYVKRQKARLKKLLAEKLQVQSLEETEQPGLTEPAFYEVVESQPNAATPSEYPAADPDWIDVRVEQQAPPEEQQMMNVVRQDTLSKAGVSTELTEDKQPEQLPYKSKNKKKKSADVGLFAEDERDRGKSRARLKSRRKSSKVTDAEDVDVGKVEEKRKKATRRGKDLKKALSSRRTLRLAA